VKVPSSDAAAAAGGAAAPRTYRMEEVTRRTNLTPRAIRYYEELGLLRPSGRTAGGFRLFTEEDIAHLIRINELQTLLGFSLAEIKQTMQVEAMRAEVREAYAGTTDPAVRQDLLDRAFSLIQAQVRVIDERVGRLVKLREEHTARLNRIRELQAAAKKEARDAGEPGAGQSGSLAEAGKRP
jgi:DNA-binding transcriptional MerR regulator